MRNIFAFFALILCSISTLLASGGEKNHRWRKNEITVCWVDLSPMDLSTFGAYQRDRLEKFLKVSVELIPKEKVLIQQKIQTEFTAERTGIFFSGWKSCQKTPTSDLKIIAGEDESEGALLGSSTVGLVEYYDHSGYQNIRGVGFLYINLIDKAKMLTPTDSMLSTIIHEFGHVAGLRHEHIRNEARKDPTCADYHLGEKPYSETSFFSAYDSNSIMSYCYLDTLYYRTGLKFNSSMVLTNQGGFMQTSQLIDWWQDRSVVKVNLKAGRPEASIKIGLSQADIHALKCMYVYDPETFQRICHSNHSLHSPSTL